MKSKMAFFLLLGFLLPSAIDAQDDKVNKLKEKVAALQEQVAAIEGRVTDVEDDNALQDQPLSELMTKNDELDLRISDLEESLVELIIDVDCNAGHTITAALETVANIHTPTKRDSRRGRSSMPITLSSAPLCSGSSKI